MNLKKILRGLVPIVFVSCIHSHVPKYLQSKRWPVMGTFFEIQSPDLSDDVAQKIFDSVRLIDEKVSTYKSSSDLSKINQNSGNQQWIPVDTVTSDLLEKSAQYRNETEGAFDISVGPLVKLWKLDQPLHGETREIPSKKNIQKTLSLVRKTRWEIRDGTARVVPEGVWLDMGGIAKGYALDRAGEVVTQSHLPCTILNLGRQISLAGTCSSSVKIGIQNPLFENKIVATIHLNRGSVSTSGAYERYFMHDGRRYGHIMQPHTGYPIQHRIVSVTVWAETATDADVWSTTLYVLGFEEGMKLLSKVGKNIGTLWIMDDGKVRYQGNSLGDVVLEN